MSSRENTAFRASQDRAQTHTFTMPSRAGRRGWRGALGWAILLVPLAVAVALVGWGAPDLPQLTLTLCLLILPLLVVPNVIQDVTGQRGRLVVRSTDRAVVLGDLGIDRVALALMALIALAAPFVATWEQAHTGADLGPLTGGRVWGLPLFGVAGLFWLRRAKRPSITITRIGVVLQSTTSRREVAWAGLPDFAKQPEPRLLNGLKAVDGPFPVYQLRSDPAVVADVLDFYRTHLMRRGEIGTDAFLDRMRRGDL